MTTSITRTQVLCDICNSIIIGDSISSSFFTPASLRPEYFSFNDIDLCSKCTINVFQRILLNNKLPYEIFSEEVQKRKDSHISHPPGTMLC